eukprot:TRINITY_DN2778_c0_g1_i1.p1 TRINITY_DN2778_c0_g1~~TRINITY_DN2778_c0_g1_i1.p1  ORF type:complete len:294 (+),score=79.55 TRINITY_DN2778_c0_g1_i1:31-882(+)
MNNSEQFEEYTPPNIHPKEHSFLPKEKTEIYKRTHNNYEVGERIRGLTTEEELAKFGCNPGDFTFGCKNSTTPQKTGITILPNESIESIAPIASKKYSKNYETGKQILKNPELKGVENQIHGMQKRIEDESVASCVDNGELIITRREYNELNNSRKPSDKFNETVFGIASTTSTRRAPEIRPLGDITPYADEPSCEALTKPGDYSEYGLLDDDLMNALPKEQLYDAFVNSGAINEDLMNLLYQRATSLISSGDVSIKLLLEVLKEYRINEDRVKKGLKPISLF